MAAQQQARFWLHDDQGNKASLYAELAMIILVSPIIKGPILHISERVYSALPSALL